MDAKRRMRPAEIQERRSIAQILGLHSALINLVPVEGEEAKATRLARVCSFHLQQVEVCRRRELGALDTSRRVTTLLGILCLDLVRRTLGVEVPVSAIQIIVIQERDREALVRHCHPACHQAEVKMLHFDRRAWLGSPCMQAIAALTYL